MSTNLKRSAVRRFERAGVSQAVATKLSGHKTPSIYRRCRSVDETDLREALTRREAAASDPGRTMIALSAAREGGSVVNRSRTVPALFAGLRPRAGSQILE